MLHKTNNTVNNDARDGVEEDSQKYTGQTW